MFRAGTIGSSMLFGLAFYLITRTGEPVNVSAEKVKDYLTISSIRGLIGILFSTYTKPMGWQLIR